MTLRHHFHAYLDDIRREGRYRIFTDLERHAARPPYACWRDGGMTAAKSSYGAPTTTLGWGGIPLLSTPWSRPRAAWAPARGYAEHRRQ